MEMQTTNTLEAMTDDDRYDNFLVEQDLEREERLSADYRTFGQVFASVSGKLCDLDQKFEEICNELEMLFELAKDGDNAILIDGIHGRMMMLQNHCYREIQDSNDKAEIHYSLGHVADKVGDNYVERLFIPEYRKSIQYIFKEDFTEELFQEELEKFKRNNNFVPKPDF